MSFIIFGEIVETFDELVEAVVNEFTYDSYWIDEDGKLPTVETKDDLHDICESWVEEEDYEKLKDCIYDDSVEFEGIYIEDSDPYAEARDFYNRTRL